MTVNLAVTDPKKLAQLTGKRPASGGYDDLPGQVAGEAPEVPAEVYAPPPRQEQDEWAAQMHQHWGSATPDTM